MKQYTIVKIGYTAGVYGCSNEYFTLIYNNRKGLQSMSFYGMYGAEERVSGLMKERGYTQKYTQSFYGRMTRKDITKNCISESEAVDLLKRYIKL